MYQETDAAADETADESADETADESADKNPHKVSFGSRCESHHHSYPVPLLDFSQELRKFLHILASGCQPVGPQ